MKQRCEKSSFLTLEAFVTDIARHLVIDLGCERVTVSALKPRVFGAADGPGVEIVRTREMFQEK
jgi:dihydroneopterin aldolase